jgi:hypothetical protein
MTLLFKHSFKVINGVKFMHYSLKWISAFIGFLHLKNSIIEKYNS